MNAIEYYRNLDERNIPAAEIRAILSRRKWQILITFLLVTAGVALATFLMPKRYETRMKILVKNERPNMVVSAGNAQSYFPSEVSETQINTEIELLNNNDLLRQVVTISGLDRLETTTGPASGDRRQVAVENATRRLQHDLEISPVRKSDIIEIKYTARDPHLAVVVLQHLAGAYLEAHLKIHGTSGTYDFFSGQAARYKNDLRTAESNLTDFRRKNDIVMFAEQKEDTLRRSSESRAMLLAAEASVREYTRKVADARSQLAAMPPRIVTQSHTVSNQYSVERLFTMLADLQNRRTMLLLKYRPDDRLVQEASQEIADTQAALEKAKSLNGSDQSTDVNPISQSLALDVAKEQAELAGLEERRLSLVQQADGYRRQLMGLGDSNTKYDDLTRDQKEAEDNYLLYAKKTEESRIADSLDQQKISNVAIAESPVESHQPFKPNVPLNLGLGTLLAAFLSLGIPFTAEYLNQPAPQVEAEMTRAHYFLETEEPPELEALTGLSVLAVTIRSWQKGS